MNESVAGLQEPMWATWVKAFALVIFGLVAISWPALTLGVLAWLTAAYVLVVGIVDLVSGVFGIGGRSYWWLKILIGAAQIGVGVYLMRRPLITLSLFILITGLFFLIRGILELAYAFDPNTDSETKSLLVVTGVIGILAGIILLRQPLEGGVAFVWVLGVYALVAGPVSVAVALRSRNS
ncbi:hypothetical protein DYH10_00770 [Candidatus Saccharibacteria bacterium CPR2]|nr:hypothetical protein [Candidatus Saccharibacteria bacterium CPR2]